MLSKIFSILLGKSNPALAYLNMSYRCYLLMFISAATAAPSVVFPINSQVPPVARTLSMFNYVFSENTFSSSLPGIRYELSNAPSWLQLDGSSRALFGQPEPKDVGPASFSVVAIDDTGSTPMPVTLVVSDDSGPKLGTPISEQLAAHGSFSGPDSLLISHSSPLSLSFSRSTFLNTNDKTVYYSFCADHTPLPSWISFDPNVLSFSGTTPQSTSPSELTHVYDIKMTASDVVGFSGAVAAFQIIVESHTFTFGRSFQTVNLTQGSLFNYTELRTDLFLDGIPAKTSDLVHIEADPPDWVSINSSNLAITGVPPNPFVSQELTITATDVYGDKANTTVLIQASNRSLGFFNSPIQTLNATSGTDFQYMLNRSLLTRPDLIVTADLGLAASWLKFDPDTLSFSGTVPNGVQSQQALINVTASQGAESQSQLFAILINGNFTNTTQNSINPSTNTDLSPNPRSTSNNDLSAQRSHKQGISRKHWLPAAIVVPIVMVVCLLSLAFLCHRKRRPMYSSPRPHPPPKEKISRPIPKDSSWITVQENENEKPNDQDTRGQSRLDLRRDSGHAQNRQSSRPPFLEGFSFWPSTPARHRSSRLRSSIVIADEEKQIPQLDPWRQFSRQFISSQQASVEIPEFAMAEAEKMPLNPLATHYSARKRHSDTSRLSGYSNHLPVRRYAKHAQSRSAMSFASATRLSSQRFSGFGRTGMGHGIRLSDPDFTQNPWGPRGFGLVRGSWRNPSVRSQNTTDYTTTTTDSSSRYLPSKHSDNIASYVQAFPRTPTSTALDPFAGTKAGFGASRSKSPQRPTIRVIHSRPQSLLKRKPGLQSSLQAFHKNRVSSGQDHSVLFSARSSTHLSSPSLRKKLLKRSGLSASESNDSFSVQGNILSKPRLEHHLKTASATDINQSYSHSSSISSPLNPSSPQPFPSNHRLKLSNGRTSPFNSFNPLSHLHARSRSRSRSRNRSLHSPTSSAHPISSAPDEETYAIGSHEDLIEDIDEDGNKRWRHIEHPNPLGANSPVPGSSSSSDHEGKDAPGWPLHDPNHLAAALWSNPDSGRRMHRLSQICAWRGADRPARQRDAAPAPEGRIIVGTKGQRPISVDIDRNAQGLTKDRSLKGDVRDYYYHSDAGDPGGDDTDGGAFL